MPSDFRCFVAKALGLKALGLKALAAFLLHGGETKPQRADESRGITKLAPAEAAERREPNKT